MTKSLLVLTTLWGVFFTHFSTAQEVNQSEVRRLGNMVQYVDGNKHQANGDDVFIQAMGTPASDADKWFVTVLTTKGCAACENLKRQWRTDAWLLAIADPSDAKKSWSHYNEYSREDRSQAWRFQNIQVAAYPTILVQPPRTGQYGKATTVVYQSTYKGDPQKLAQEIASAIRLYVGKLQQEGLIQDTVTENKPDEHDELYGINPPWQPVPKVDATLPSFPNIEIPPIPIETKFEFPWLSLFTAGISVPTIVGLVIWIVILIRNKRKAEGKKLLLDDETFDKLIDKVKELVDAQAKPTTRRTKAPK